MTSVNKYTFMRFEFAIVLACTGILKQILTACRCVGVYSTYNDKVRAENSVSKEESSNISTVARRSILQLKDNPWPLFRLETLCGIIYRRISMSNIV